MDEEKANRLKQFESYVKLVNRKVQSTEDKLTAELNLLKTRLKSEFDNKISSLNR